MRATTVLGQNVLPRSRKARAILAYMCIAHGKPVARARLAEMLWDRVPGSQARASFRQAFHELCSALGASAAELISGDLQTLRLQLDLCWIDALAAIDHESSPDRMLSDLLELCSGELLEDLDGASASFDHWLLTERTRFSGKIKALLEEELRDIDQPGIDASQRAAISRRVIAYDETYERASRALMRALTELGDRAQALREYDRCRAALKASLDVEPSLESQALYAEIRSTTGARAKSVHSQSLSSVPLEPPRRELMASRTRLRVGVMPFHVLNGRRDRGLSVSLSLEIAAALARFRWFDVIALSLHHRGAPQRREVRGKELDYLVDGTVRGVGDRLQISVRLLDSPEMRVVWSDRLELALDELHLLDERVTARIVGRIDPVILFIEGQPKRREYYGATGLLLRAIPLMYSMQRAKYEEAGKLIQDAVRIDPENAMAAAWAAHWQVFHVGQGWAPNGAEALAIAQRFALRAIQLDPDNAEAFGIYAHVCAFLDKDFHSALHYFDRSLRLNPSLGFVWALSAITHCYVGMPDVALVQMERYRNLAPFDPYLSFFDGVTAIAYLLKRDYDRAAALARHMVKAYPGFINGYKTLIAALGHLGRRSDAKPYIEKLLALEPSFSIERFASVYPLQKKDDRETLVRGLRLAGA